MKNACLRNHETQFFFPFSIYSQLFIQSDLLASLDFYAAAARN